MTTSAQAAVLVSLAADALSLGAHWFYDTAEIDRRFGRVEGLLAPPPDSFHAPEGVPVEMTSPGHKVMSRLM